MTNHKPDADKSQPHLTLDHSVIPFGLLDTPLEYIFADHGRQRTICHTLQRIASEHQASRAEADRVAAFLTVDRVVHHADEDEDLYPAIRRRALPEDNLGAVLARLGEDHRRSEALVEDIVAELCKHPARDPVRISEPVCELIQSFATNEARHLAVENAVILAIARIRLSAGDLKAMSKAMKLRRGVCV